MSKKNYHVAKGTITHLQLLNLLDYAAELVPAPGPGKVLNAINAVFTFDVTTPYADGNPIFVRLGPEGGSVTEPVAAAFLYGNADMVGFSPVKWNSNAWPVSDYENQGLFLGVLGQNFTGGHRDNKVHYKIVYQIWDTDL